MKTQTSHPTNRDHKQYSGVYQQQGRMITDADWNALTDIEKQRLINALSDTLASGAPRHGGLRLSDDQPVRIQPGRLYVEGVPAQLTAPEDLAPTEQPDYPQPPEFTGQNLTLYADVWERQVTALEDTDLMDPALHGADTTSRSETMLQVKWCADHIDPEAEDQNPAMGSATLALRLRHIFVGEDPCDPCASEMNLDERVGNYLFRVEVHDRFVDPEDGAHKLVLKWSRDNGAEAHAVDNFPIGFNRGHWVWEFFDPDSEKSLGRHFPEDYRPRRGYLTSEFEVPDGDQPKQFVRQWDGYLTLNLDSVTLESGVDRGTTLHTDGSPDAHGWVGLEGGVLTLNGERLEFRLDFANRNFVPGDYWQAAVREAVQNSGDYVLGSEDAAEPPLGIQHHYLTLRRLDGNGGPIAHSDAELRRFHFPPLTDIMASDVGFSNPCEALYGDAENLQKALAALCDIGARHIAYSLPECEPPVTVGKLLQKALGEQWPDYDQDGKVSVKDMLDSLLCHLNSDTLPHELPDCAGTTLKERLDFETDNTTVAHTLNRLLCDTTASHIPLDRKDKLCKDLEREDVESVQDALNVLCHREQGSGGGCARVVELGTLADVLKELINQEADSIWLCLKPGLHELPEGLDLKANRHIRITGAGYRSTEIRVQAKQWQLRSLEIQLSDLGIQFSEDHQGQIFVEAEDVTLEGLMLQSFKREEQDEKALLHVRGPSPWGVIVLRFRENRLFPITAGKALYLEQVSHIAYFEKNWIEGDVHYSPKQEETINVSLDPARLADKLNFKDTKILVETSEQARHPFFERRRIAEGGQVSSEGGILFIENNVLSRWVSFLEEDKLIEEGQIPGPFAIYASNNVIGTGSSLIAGTIKAQGNQVFRNHTQVLWLLSNQLIAQGHLAENKEIFAHYSAPDHAIANNLMKFES